MKLGIVGLPNVGKSTLFNSLTKAGAESANYPFCTIDPIRHICDFSRGGLNVRSCARIQTLLRDHKYALLGAMASVLWLEKVN